MQCTYLPTQIPDHDALVSFYIPQLIQFFLLQIESQSTLIRVWPDFFLSIVCRPVVAGYRVFVLVQAIQLKKIFVMVFELFEL